MPDLAAMTRWCANAIGAMRWMRVTDPMPLPILALGQRLSYLGDGPRRLDRPANDL